MWGSIRAVGRFRRQTHHRAPTEAELLRIRSRISQTFNAETDETHRLSLERIWNSLREDRFKPDHDGWKELGFQGSDPCTDVRAGGALAIDCLEYMAVVHKEAYQKMLKEVAERVSREGIEGCCPLGTTAVILARLICDETGVTEPMRPPIPAEDIKMMVAQHATRPLWKFTVSEKNTLELFSCLLLQFFARYVRKQVTYMQLGENTKEVQRQLLEWANTCANWEELRNKYMEDPEIHAAVHGSWGEALKGSGPFVQNKQLDRDIWRLRAELEAAEDAEHVAEDKAAAADAVLLEALEEDLQRVQVERSGRARVHI